MTERKRKYLFLTSEGSFFPDLIQEGKQRPGSYQWYRAFRNAGWEADVKHINAISKDELLSADLIHWNGAGCNLKFIRETKSMLVNAKKATPVILNADYPFEDTEAGVQDPLEFLKTLFCVDMVFVQEPSQLTFYQYLINYCDPVVGENRFRGRQIPFVPHPVETSLRDWRIPVDERLNMIAVLHRRYGGGQLFMPSWITQNMIKKFSNGSVEPILTMVHGLIDPLAPTFMYDYVGGRGPGNWEKYILMLSYSKWAFSYPMHHTHDRFAPECACLGLPLVTNEYSYFGQVMYPELTCHPIDFEGMRYNLQRLIDDEDFYVKCCEYADKAVEEFNWEKSYERLIKEMNQWGIAVEP